MKDLRKGAGKNSTGSAPDEDSVPVGEGEVDWKAVLSAAQRARVEHYFIEDEANKGDRFVIDPSAGEGLSNRVKDSWNSFLPDSTSEGRAPASP